MWKNIEIVYLKQAEKFLDKNPHKIEKSEVKELVILAIKRLIFKREVNLDLKPLKGKFKGFFRIRKGDIRIIISIKNGDKVIISIVENIDFRENIYK